MASLFFINPSFIFQQQQSSNDLCFKFPTFSIVKSSAKDNIYVILEAGKKREDSSFSHLNFHNQCDYKLAVFNTTHAREPFCIQSHRQLGTFINASVAVLAKSHHRNEHKFINSEINVMIAFQ